MSASGDAQHERPADKPAPEIAEIFRLYGEAYRHTHPLSPEQLRVMGNIETCRTEIRGGHVDTCDHCGHQQPSYNSCSDRHCPKCQAMRQAKWIASRKERILPTAYFHLVFTLPAELRPLALCNRQLIFDMLFSSAAQTLLELGQDPKHLGALLGITAVLHTWTRELDFHPHLHCVVTGGGLDIDGDRWLSSNPKFLFPVQVLSRLFRGKFLSALSHAQARGELQFAGTCTALSDPKQFARLKDRLYTKQWVVYAKSPFGGPQAVFEYLGRYTHRVAISNQRIISFDHRGVTFHTKHGNTATLPPTEFIRRFLLHVLPGGFTKIRHFGLLAPGKVNSQLLRARTRLEAVDSKATAELKSGQQLAQSLLEQLIAANQTPTTCPKCGSNKWYRSYVEPGTGFPNPAQYRSTS